MFATLCYFDSRHITVGLVPGSTAWELTSGEHFTSGRCAYADGVLKHSNHSLTKSLLPLSRLFTNTHAAG